MNNYNNVNNYNKYHKITKKSGCVSIKYKFKDDDDDQTLIIEDNQNEISGNYNNIIKQE